MLEERGLKDIYWREVGKSKYAPEEVEKALAHKADLIFVWGGDGMVQRCIDVAAGTDATLAIIPAGTANLLATNLGIPKDLEQAVDIGLARNVRRIDVGRLNGECFAVMAGAGFDAEMIGDADGDLKDRFGRLAYVWTGAKHLREKPFHAKIRVDGARWYDGEASCILLGNVGKLFGGVEAFEDAHPDDGVLELGVRLRRGRTRVGGHGRPRGRRHGEQVAARVHDEGALGAHQARPQGRLRDRRRRPQEGAQDPHRRAARRRVDLRARAEPDPA